MPIYATVICRGIWLVVLLFIFVGCSKAPSCSDETVKRAAVDISSKEIRNAVAIQGQGFGDYDNLKMILENPSTTGEQRKVLQEVFDSANAMAANISLVNIRITEKHDDVKMCGCSGDLNLSTGKTIAINYTAQYTEDGKVYVKVTGLR